MKHFYTLLSFCLYLFSSTLQAQVVTHTQNYSVNDVRTGYYAFTNATIYTDYQTKLEKATLIIKNGKVEAVGTNLSVPAGATEIDLNGRYIYPSFIDLYSNYGVVTKGYSGNTDGQFLESPDKTALHWNYAIRPQLNAQDLFTVNGGDAKNWRKNGFGVVVTHHQDGIMRGTGALVTLADGKAQEVLLQGKAAHFLDFDKGTSPQDYPSSLMGSVALLRQTYLDADWYKKATDKKEYNLSLEALNNTLSLPAIFAVEDKLSLLRADKVGDEFGIQYIIKGNGDEYQRLQEIKATGAMLLLSLNFPDAYEVEDPFDAKMLSLEQLKHWEMAPANAAMVSKEGITFAFTSNGLKNMDDFIKNIRKAIEYGLSETEALKAITFTPAQIIKAQDKVGSLTQGKLANFIITSQPVFDKSSTILENWIQGKQYILKDINDDIRGNYNLSLSNGESAKIIIAGTPDKLDVKIDKNGTTQNADFSLKEKLISLQFSLNDQKYRLSGWVEGKNLKGIAETDNSSLKWNATFESAYSPTAEEKKENSPIEVGKVVYPFTAYGNAEIPKTGTYLIKNGTVWTNEKEGILKETDVLIKDGKITQIGKNLNANGATVIDATGKHVTCGIIDEHSHIALANVNEGSHSSTAEVRMGDVIDSESMSIYRQIAGGVCAAQLLHGSANTIGGQSALIKLKWGFAPESMKIPNADGFIKFALGENVKQANWGDGYRTRFPQTRMGVEQFLNDVFTRAREYETLSKTKGAIYRRDLNMEATLEILNQKRFITCHSYVQSEINMLMKLAESFNFRVNTFTHILEGYKVADKMAKHGAGGSSFADWWAYKMEVKDAIPHNPALMHSQGVVVSINSDDTEMARRLNQEAAKAVKYGGVSEEDAWKMVTLNPAKLLHLDSRMGSLKAGKDADIVVWSDNPLSIYAVVEKNIIDGILFFDLEKEAEKLQSVEQEKARIIKKMIDAKNGGASTQKAVGNKQREWHCEDVVDWFKEKQISEEYIKE
ncbi:MAG: amidohydrolase [Cytophagales bacterium]|nr:MAG: amidohydrolase [Cytophagales bacterium]